MRNAYVGSTALAAALLLAVCFCLPGFARAGAVTLSYANFPPAPTFPCVQMERWKTEIEKRTNNAVNIQTYPGSTLLGAKNMFHGVIQGQADIGCLCMSYQPGVFPLVTACEQPVGFASATVAGLALWDIFNKYKPKAFKDVVVLTMFTSAPSNIMSKVPVKTLADLQGLELRASGAPAKALGLLGATPVSMPMSETPEALQKGVVKGLLSSLEVLKDFKFAESCRYETITDLPVYVFAVVMNKRSFASLPKDVQKAMLDMGREQCLWTGQYMDGHVKESVAWSKKTYDVDIFELSQADQEAIAAKTAPLVNAWKEQANKAGYPADQVMAEVLRLKKTYEQQYGK